MHDIRFELSPVIPDEALNQLFAAAWPSHVYREFADILRRSAAYVCAFAGYRLVGFANVAWDGGEHAFLLDPTVHPDVRRRGIGTELVRRAVDAARDRGLAWIHVDYEPSLEGFYERCAFRRTAAGVINLRESAG